ncbi:MAG: hypothetical protein C0594_13340 [Marinilabiliales bacterium]|nr:MAG: hypothetical protein C0594_13340 [Marinilabiliales bacterium]
MEFTWMEIVGYLASAFIAFAMMNTSFIRLRLFGLIGNVLFIVYGLLIHAYPIAFVNFIIAVVNVIYLFKLYHKQEYFKIQEIRNDNKYLLAFIDFYRNDIHKSIPQFKYYCEECSIGFFVLRNMAVAGVFLAKEHSPGVIMVILDYVIPQYRDFKLGSFLFVKSKEYFKNLGYSEIRSLAKTQAHKKYLIKMGFQQAKDEKGDCFVLNL